MYSGICEISSYLHVFDPIGWLGPVEIDSGELLQAG